jgi:hypothetical protein
VLLPVGLVVLLLGACAAILVAWRRSSQAVTRDLDGTSAPVAQWPLEGGDGPPLGSRSSYGQHWWPLVVIAIAHVLAVVVVFLLEPAGFDRCEASPSATAQAVQRSVAGVAVIGSAALALWRVRGWRLLAVLAPTGLAALVWALLLDDSQHC